MPNFEKFVPLRKQRVSMKRKAVSKAKKIAPVRLVRTSNCPYQKEFDAMRDQFVEQCLQTGRLAALETLRGAVQEEIENRKKKTGFFDEAKAWEHIEAALRTC